MDKMLSSLCSEITPSALDERRLDSKNRHVVILRMVRQRYDAITCDNDQQLEYFTKACRDRKELFLFEDELKDVSLEKMKSEEDGD
ncbi:hypothetical protein HAX54_001273 [Datura stramonium]|uniref:Uncharacterized protein n=1 Tax=Datura stramonium TaxID=4076 RepID=A0ABS8T258_DATST|nr:hypothetical protein [Datura stramonium]